MLDYVFLFISVVLLAGNFSTGKIYQIKEGSSNHAGFLNAFYTSIFTAALILVINGMKLEITLFSLIMAVLQTFFSTSYTIIGLKIMKYEKMALYIVFLMTGGMIIPYIWGLLFLGEAFSVLRTIGLIVIAVAVVITNGGISKTIIKVMLMCVAAFILNGFVSVVSKEHQISANAVSTNSFIILGNLTKLIIMPIILLIEGKGHPKMKISSVSMLSLAGGAAFGGISSMLMLLGAKNIDASVLYPFTTGGTIIFTAHAGKAFFKEKITPRIAAGIIKCLVGTCMFIDFSIFI